MSILAILNSPGSNPELIGEIEDFQKVLQAATSILTKNGLLPVEELRKALWQELKVPVTKGLAKFSLYFYATKLAYMQFLQNMLSYGGKVLAQELFIKSLPVLKSKGSPESERIVNAAYSAVYPFLLTFSILQIVDPKRIETLLLDALRLQKDWMEVLCCIELLSDDVHERCEDCLNEHMKQRNQWKQACLTLNTPTEKKRTRTLNRQMKVADAIDPLAAG